MPHGRRWREPFTMALPQSSLSITMELLLIGHCFAECLDVSVLTTATRCKVPKHIYHWYHRENIPEDSVLRPYIVSIYEEVNQDTFEKATANQQHFTVTDELDYWDTVARGSLRHPSWGISSLWAGKIQQSHYPGDGGDMFLWNIGSNYSHTVWNPKRHLSLKNFVSISHSHIMWAHTFLNSPANLSSHCIQLWCLSWLRLIRSQ
jgi:hypothetical protein